MSQLRSVRKPLLSAAVVATLLVTAGQFAPSAHAQPNPAKADASQALPAAFAGRTAPSTNQGANPFDEVQHLGKAPKQTAKPLPAPGGLKDGRVAGPQTKAAAPTRTPLRAAGVACTLDGITGLSPQGLADFLTDPAVTADGCLRGLVWTWDARLAPVMSRAHVQAVANRAASLAATHDGKNSSHLLELFTYLHAVAYQDYGHDEIDVTDAPTVEAMRQAVAALGSAAHTFDVTATNAQTLREALYAASAPGLRQHQLPLIQKVLATMAPGAPTATNADWSGPVLAALSVNYLGIYPGNNDTAFRTAVAADPTYRAAFRVFSGYTHLKGTANEWAPRDALSEYGRFGQIDSLKSQIAADLGALLPATEKSFGKMSAPWMSLATWLNFYGDCATFNVCKDQIEKQLFTHTYSYDNGAIQVRTALDQATVDQLYYASKQVKTQFFRVLGTDKPLAGDTNSTLHIHLYASRADYEVYQPFLTGFSTANGGMYIEDGATFYTYQRRVPQDSSLTLEELFRHEYTHYLNGRWAVPGLFGQGAWFTGDRTTAMDEGTAEFFDGGTRDDGIAVRKSLVKGVIADTAGGGPRMSVEQLLHATYDGDGFRFYNYAGTFFEFLWNEHPSLLREMYGYERADDPKGFDAWRERMGHDAGIQKEYDKFLDEQIAKVDTLYVPNTKYTPNAKLRYSKASDVRAAFAKATYSNPDCVDNGDPGKHRFICTGRITARLGDANDADQVFEDMSDTVDSFILDRAGDAANNFADMNCFFGTVDIWANKQGGTSTYTCEGPLRS
ncbi:collagenase [Streptomyces sp. CBMA152]|uniref:collagenase n=1 Tax=Streptomyces sp. CBMA152 TaxID=1896312 RepID=UPI0016610961|nr:collagenase [Streptomyces sp. CBMA152]MBD0744527.1 peptidase M9 [Streptomyces sp. CBMA152]